MTVKEVAIIGCGVAGLASIKCCIDAGLNPTCFEIQQNVGGVWNYTDEPRPNLASVHRNTVTNTSKQFSAYSDFPMPKSFPNYLPHRVFQTYLESYAKHFDLVKHVQFGTEVVHLQRSNDHKDTGKWLISTRKADSEITTKSFDAVMICTGHLWEQFTPKIPGIDKFTGTIIHSGDYRTFHPYVGKRVVVVGCSNSGGDISVDICNYANQVYLSTRSGGYLMTRVGPGGKPLDFLLTRAISKIVPLKIAMKMSPALLNNKVDFKTYGLQPTGTFNVDQFPFINDELLHHIISGKIKVKKDIREVSENSVTLKDGEILTNVDALIFATGFKHTYPFASDIIETKADYYVSLYKHMFLPSNDQHTLAVIGAILVQGADAPTCEMQARVAVEVFAKKCMLPSKCKMEQAIKDREDFWKKTGTSKSNYMRVNFLPYLDELGEMIGAKPDLWSILKQDPILAFKVLFSPAIPAQFRLQGPNAWSGARQHIMDINEHYLGAFKATGDHSSTKDKSNGNFFYFVYLAILIIVMALLWSYCQ